MKATEYQIRELAGVVESQAGAIANGLVTGPLYAAVKRLQHNVDTLAEWVGDDR